MSSLSISEYLAQVISVQRCLCRTWPRTSWCITVFFDGSNFGHPCCFTFSSRRSLFKESVLNQFHTMVLIDLTFQKTYSDLAEECGKTKQSNANCPSSLILYSQRIFWWDTTFAENLSGTILTPSIQVSCLSSLTCGSCLHWSSIFLNCIVNRNWMNSRKAGY